MTENERIRKLRKEILGLTLDKFSKALGVSRSAISDVENGRNALSNQMVMLIRKVYNVNEEWLRTGEGDVFRNITDEERTAETIDYVMEIDPDSEKLTLINKLKDLDDETVHALLMLVEAIKK